MSVKRTDEGTQVSSLFEFVSLKMSMSEVYQPVIIKELLENGGECSKVHLAKALSQYDAAVQDYYKKVLMRWPKSTLTKHKVVTYDQGRKTFVLSQPGRTESEKAEIVKLCESKIAEWFEKKKEEGSPAADASLRYRVIAKANGKCENCGIPKGLKAIDIDHIVPKSRADKKNTVPKDGKRIPVNSEGNLQALCFSCNRGKRAGDDRDFRRRQKLVRDRVPAEIEASGRAVAMKRVKGAQLFKALNEKLVEEHEEYMFEVREGKREGRLEELADMIEVIVSLAREQGLDEHQLLDLAAKKRSVKGGFGDGCVLLDVV